MCKYTEIKKINDAKEFVDYKIFDKTIEPTTFFIRVIKSNKMILCSIYENMNNPFFQLDLSDPDYESKPLSQNTIQQFAFVRGVMRIVKAINNNNLADDLSYM